MNFLSSGFEPLSKKDRPSNTKQFKGEDITGFYGQQVVALLSQIVNDKEQFTNNKTFYLLIRDSSEDSHAGFEELFRLNARPSQHQPGNAIVFLRPRGYTKFTQDPKSYNVLIQTGHPLETHVNSSRTTHRIKVFPRPLLKPT